MRKALEWDGMYQRYKNINLNKVQRSNERVSQDKESFERHNNDSLQNKKVRKFVAFLTGVLGCLNVNRAVKKNMQVDKISRINFKIKGPQNLKLLL